jgi:hypothetical protein
MLRTGESGAAALGCSSAAEAEFALFFFID